MNKISISKQLLKFLIINKIDDIENLFNIELSKLIQYNGFSMDIGQEIITLSVAKEQEEENTKLIGNDIPEKSTDLAIKGIVKNILPDGKINIPLELRELPTSKIFLFKRNLSKISSAKITRITNNFVKLSDLHGLSKKELLNIPSVGKNIANFMFEWFNSFHCGTFKSLIEMNKNIASQSIDEFNCSPYCVELLKEHGIFKMGDLTILDVIHKSKLTEFELTVLLELRTLQVDLATNTISTLANFHNVKIDFTVEIDQFINDSSIKAELQLIIARRWAENKKLQTIGDEIGLTRERIRQILIIILGLYDTLYLFNKDHYYNYFKNIVFSKMDSIVITDITNVKENKLKYPSQFYLSFLNSVFVEIPFKTSSMLYDWGQIKPTLGKLYKTLTEPYKTTVTDYFVAYSDIEKLKWLKVILYSDRIQIALYSGEYYLNRKFYSFEPIMKHYLENSSKPRSLKEIVNYLSTNELYRSSEEEVIKAAQSKQGKSISLAQRMQFVAGCYHLDKYLWGTEKHLGYPKSDWTVIGQACVDVLKNEDHQADAGYIFRKIEAQFPMLHSKYELVHILKQEPRIEDLGFFSFKLKGDKPTKRILVKDLIHKCFNENWQPKHSTEIIDYIRKYRHYRFEGLKTTMHQLDEIQNYPCNYYGLKERDKENREILIKNTNFIVSYYNYNNTLFTKINLVLEELQISKSQDEFIQFLTQIPNFLIYKSKGTEDVYHFLINLKWSLKRQIKTYLANIRESLNLNATLNDFPFITHKKNLTKKQIYRLRSYFISDPKFSLDENGLVSFNMSR